MVENLLCNENTARRGVDSLCILSLDNSVSTKSVAGSIGSLGDVLLDMKGELALGFTVVGVSSTSVVWLGL